MNDQASKGARFVAMHRTPGTFVMPNPWDAGSARLLAGLGFEALATTSLGVANMLGTRRASRDAVLGNCRDIAAACALPVSVDLENGFADRPECVAECIRLAYECGAVGASVEDASGDPAAPLYDLGLATERVAAAVDAARALPTPFVLTARAENLLFARGGLDETLRRLHAYETAGADVLYAPALRDLESIRTVTGAVTAPLNVVMGLADPGLTLDQLRAAGVRRVSVGGALSRVALAAVVRAAREMQDAGRFTFVRDMLPLDTVRGAFGVGP